MLHEIGRVAARVPYTMFRQEHAVRVVSPTRTHPSNVRRSESLRQCPLRSSSPNVVDKLTHHSSIACLTAHTGLNHLPCS